MPYTPTTWINDTAPAINAVNLNKMETGIQNATMLAEAFSGLVAVTTKTANYTATISDDVILADATGGAFQVTLPTAAGNTGQVIEVKRVSTNANAVTIATTGGQTIDGASTYAPLALESVPMVSDGTNWWIV